MRKCKRGKLPLVPSFFVVVVARFPNNGRFRCSHSLAMLEEGPGTLVPFFLFSHNEGTVDFALLVYVSPSKKGTTRLSPFLST